MVCLWDYALFYISFLIGISNKCLKCAGEYHFRSRGIHSKIVEEIGWDGQLADAIRWYVPEVADVLCASTSEGEHTVFGQGCDDLYFKIVIALERLLVT